MIETETDTSTKGISSICNI